MNQTHTPLPKQSTLIPLFFSVLVHGAIAGALFLYQPSPKAPTPTGIETSLVGQDDLLAIEGAIRENAKNAQAQETAAASPPTKQPSDAIRAYNQKLAEREAKFNAQMAKFNAQQKAHQEAQMQAFEAELEAQRQAEEAELQEAREAYANQDELVKENQKELAKAKEAREQANNDAEKAKQGTGKTTSVGKDDGDAKSGTNASTTKTTQGTGKNNIQTAVANHIKAHWNPIGETGTRLSTSIRVDAEGNVLSVSVSGGTEAQRESLERAIYASSPITPIVGTEFRSFSPYFVVQ